ncbi:MAG: hypothetical protein J6B01_06745 [Ruminococcus sp.]|nr:hypothetical protein [Ruminococcus sp.]
MKENIISVFVQKTKAYPLSTRWLRFQAFCRLPLIGVLYTVASVATLFNGIGFQMLFALCGITCLIALMPTLRLQPHAYRLNIAVAISMILYAISVMNMTIVVLEMFEIYYFVKRKELFSSKN